jgi:hypothetical protein
VKGFWRIDRDKEPELRASVLFGIAASVSGATSIERQPEQDEAALPPEAVVLREIGFGHDDRARTPQPVASRLGARLYDWQIVQGADESWRECDLHAENLRKGDAVVSRGSYGNVDSASAAQLSPRAARVAEPPPQTSLFG